MGVRVLGLLLFVVVSLHGKAQGTFRNLDFEQATVAPAPINGYGDLVDPAFAFPGWTLSASSNGFPGLYVLYNNATIDAPAIDLIGPSFPNRLGKLPLQGSYSVLFQHSYLFGVSPIMTQSGLVPSNAKSIFISSDVHPPGVYLNDIYIPLQSLGGIKFGGDITAFAGLSAQLKIIGAGYFDDIRFSSDSVPEPATLSILGIGLFAFGLRRSSFRS